MEKLAWIELLDRHGDVSARHAVHAWPFTVGRAYSNDLVLDDPHVAANHVEISLQDEGRYRLIGLDSINGMTIDTLRGKQSDASISAKDVVRIGQTQLRIRPLDFAVSPEKPLPSHIWMRSWPVLLAGIVVLHLLHLLTTWLNYDRADGYTIMVAPLLGDIPLLLLWAGFWALIGRVTMGRANFIAHAVIATLGAFLLLFLNSLLYVYVDFAFNTKLMSEVFSTVIETLIIGGMLYQHICLVSRVNRRKLGMIVAGLMLTLVGLAYGIDKWTGDDNLARMSFSRTIGPPAMLLVHGKSTEAFLAGTAKLKAKVDEMKAKMDD